MFLEKLKKDVEVRVPLIGSLLLKCVANWKWLRKAYL